MKIRMKVKHLLFIMIGVLLFIPLVTFIIKPQVHLYVTKKKLEQGDFASKSELLDILESNKILDNQKWEIIQDVMFYEGIERQFDAIVGPSYTQYSHDNAVTFSWEEKLPYLKKYIKEGPINEYLLSSAKQLVTYYTETANQVDKADDILEKAIQRTDGQEDSWIRGDLQLEQIQLAMNHEDYSKATTLLQKLAKNTNQDDYYFQAKIDQKNAEIKFYQGDLNGAYKEVKNALAAYITKEKDELEAGGTTDVYEELLSMEGNLQNALTQDGASISVVKGRIIRNDGKPMANVGVFLRPSYDVNRSVSIDDLYQMTDSNGYFKFKNVLPGDYQISLGLMFEQINGWTWPVDMDDWILVEGKNEINYDITFHPLINIHSPVNQQKITEKNVHFSWDKVEDASYYHLQLGVEIESGNISSAFKTHLTDNQVTVPIDELYHQEVSVSFADEDMKLIDPKSLLAFTNTDNRFFWSVEAYTKEGELITRSDGYRLDEETIGNLPFFFLKERQMTDADQLLLDKKIKKAFAAYKANYEKNKNDIHSLRMIVRLMNAMSEDPIDTIDSNETIPYLKTLAEKTHSPNILYRLVDYYYESQEWNAFHKWFADYSNSVDNHIDEYSQTMYASALMKQGKMVEADKQFKKSLEKDKTNEFVGYWLAVKLYKGDAFDDVLQTAKTYPEHYIGERNPNWYQLIQAMRQESKTDKAYRQKLKDALDLSFQNKEDALSKWTETTKKKAMKAFIKAIEEVD